MSGMAEEMDWRSLRDLNMASLWESAGEAGVERVPALF